MPQEHYVLRCFSCETFQAHIVKKTKKWECKMCGVKQSVKRNYGRGSGGDCRNQVMKLNELRFKNECNFNETEIGTSDDDLTLPELKVQLDPNKPFTSKWEKYLEKPVTDPESEVDDSVRDFFVEVEGRKKKRAIEMPQNSSNSSKKVCRQSNSNGGSPSVKSYLHTPPSDQKNFESYKTKEKDSPVQSKNILKLSKYAKYMDDDKEDGHHDVDIGDDDNKVRGSGTIVANKFLNVFDSEPTDLNKILSFE